MAVSLARTQHPAAQRTRADVMAGAMLCMAAALLVSCSDPPMATTPTTPTTVVSTTGPRLLRVRSGALTPGTLVEIELANLNSLRNRTAVATVWSTSPINDRTGYAEVGELQVIDDATAVIRFWAPNTLSGEDDIVELTPGTPTELRLVTSDEPTVTESIEIRFARAEVGTPYRVRVREGSPICGGPPLQVDFDGHSWALEDRESASLLYAGEEGLLTVDADDSAEFLDPHGNRSRLVVADYAC